MEKQLIELLMQVFSISEIEAKIASMNSTTQWDSLTHVELMMSLEEEFNISKITSDEIVMMIDIENILKVIISKSAKI